MPRKSVCLIAFAIVALAFKAGVGSARAQTEADRLSKLYPVALSCSSPETLGVLVLTQQNLMGVKHRLTATYDNDKLVGFYVEAATLGEPFKELKFYDKPSQAEQDDQATGMSKVNDVRLGVCEGTAENRTRYLNALSKNAAIFQKSAAGEAKETPSASDRKSYAIEMKCPDGNQKSMFVMISEFPDPVKNMVEVIYENGAFSDILISVKPVDDKWKMLLSYTSARSENNSLRGIDVPYLSDAYQQVNAKKIAYCDGTSATRLAIEIEIATNKSTLARLPSKTN